MLHVLLVEDNQNDYLIVQNLLEKLADSQVEVEGLNNYEDIQAALAAKRYDACLLNYRPDARENLEFLQEIVASSLVPVILLAQNDEYQVDAAAAKIGAADYLLKPELTSALLGRSIRYAIEQKKVTEALRRSEERYYAFTDNSTEAIWCCEMEIPCPITLSEEEQLDWFYQYGRLADCNETMAQLYGFSHPEEMIGARLDDLLVRSSPENTEYLEAFIRSGHRLTDAESCEVDRYGQTKYFLNNLAAIIENESIQRVWGTQRDVTERKKHEEALQQKDALIRIAGRITRTGGWAVEVENQALFWSDEVFDITEYPRGAIPSLEDAQALYASPWREEIVADFEACLIHGIPFDTEVQINTFKGRRIWVRVSGEAERYTDGTIKRAHGAIQDISERKQHEEALRESENELRTLTEAMPQIVWVTGPDGSLLDLNRRWTEYTGLSLEESQGTGWGTVVHPDDRIRTVQFWKEAGHSNGTYEMEYRLRRIDGEYRWMLGRAVPQYDDTGAVLKWFGTSTDIHDLKLAEAEITQSNREQRELAEQLEMERARLVAAQSVSKVGSWDVDFSTQKLLWSAETYRIYERDPALFEPTNENVGQFVPEEDRPALRQAYFSSVESQDSKFMAEHRLIMPDGRIKFIEQRWQIFRDEHGKALRATGTIQDITERQEAEAQLHFQKTLLEAQTEASLDGILVVAKGLDDAKILSYNQRFVQMWGIPPEIFASGYDAPLLQWTSDKIVNNQQFAERVAYLYEHPEERSEEEIFLHDGRIFERYSAPVTNSDGYYYGRVWYFRDITERRRSQEALRISTERFEILSRATNDAIWDWDLQTGKLWWNKGFETFFGYKRDEIEPGIESWTSRLHPADFDRIHHDIHAVIESGNQIWSAEYSFRKNDGSYAVVFDRGFIIHDANQRPVRMVGSMQDITERKRSEEALRASEERFQDIVANVPGMVYQFEVSPDGSVEWPFISEGCREMFGVEPEEIKLNPKLPSTMIHPDDRSGFELSAQNAIQTRRPWTWEGRLRMPSGEIRWIQGTAVPRLADENALWTGLLTDITDRKIAEGERDHFFTMSLDILAIVGLDGNFKRVNPAFVNALGFTETELMTQPFRERIHPDDLAITELAVDSLRQGRPVTDLVNRYQAKDGSWRWFEWKVVLAAEEGVLYAAARDVTERNKAEAALRRMHDELEVRVQERTLELEQSNRALQEEIGRREQAMRELRSRTRQQEAVAELGRRALTDIDIDVLFDGAMALILSTLGADVCGILEFVPGEESLLVRAGAGLPPNVVGRQKINAGPVTPAGHTLRTGEPVIIADIQTETRFEQIPEAIENGITSSIDVVIQSDEKTLGVLYAGLRRGRSFTRDDAHSLQAMSNVLAAAIERRRVESEIRQLNEKLKETNELLLIENTERQLALSALKDSAHILQQANEEAEQARTNAERANLAKSEFLSRMSHELRTPLNAILGFGQLLEMRNQNADSKQQESIQQILKAGRHLLQLINEVLDIARIEAGHLSLSPEPVEVGFIVQETLDIMRPLAATRNVSLTNEVAEGCSHQQVLADQQRLRQILLNLISNAVKYNRSDGKVIVLCESIASDSARNDAIETAGHLRISVSDTGPGLTPSEIARLFIPFERLEAANSQVEGTGIGLSVCKRLVEIMGGRIGVESEKGQGSKFWVELPMVKNPFSSESSEKTAPPVIRTSAFESPHTILYIEDNLSNLNLVEHIVTDMSRQIRLLPAMQGRLGLDLAVQHTPDLILLDVNLPDMAGDVVLNQLKANPATADIPVIVLSADATEYQIDRLLEAGASHYLTKPLDIGKLLSILRQTLESSDTLPGTDNN